MTHKLPPQHDDFYRPSLGMPCVFSDFLSEHTHPQHPQSPILVLFDGVFGIVLELAWRV